MKSTLFTVILSISALTVYAQDTTSIYSTDSFAIDEDGMVIDKNNEIGEPMFKKENIIKGSEFMIFIQNNLFLLEAAPFVGYSIKDVFWLGAGLNGTYVTALGGNGNEKLYGYHGFARINIAASYFLQAEFRRVNAPKINNFVGGRQWVATPVFGGGYQFGDNAWLYIGYASNPEFVKVNPLGNLVYRFGFLF